MNIPAELRSAITEALIYCKANATKGNLGYAVPYLENFNEAIDRFPDRPADAVRTQILYALGNLGVWRGDDARRVKEVFRAYLRRTS